MNQSPDQQQPASTQQRNDNDDGERQKQKASFNACFKPINVEYHLHYSHTEESRSMALRRPPTRVELKADDIEEYNEV